ncbi:pseudouridine synthase [bacterium]|nr:pseudouridine synthase [bacterium]
MNQPGAESEDSGQTMRIARFLARCGVAARRKAETLVTEGRVTLNGTVITDLGRQVDPQTDSVTVDGVAVRLATSHLTIVMNKPIGCVTTRNDPDGRQTVYDLLPGPFRSRSGELVYVGRLDFNTSGLLILSTDGDLVHRLSHPSQKITKTYEVRSQIPMPDRFAALLMRGVDLDDGPARAVAARFFDDDRCRLLVAIEEGRNRQVRRMMDALGFRVTALERTAIGALKLSDLGLAKGEAREIESDRLLQLIGGRHAKS